LRTACGIGRDGRRAEQVASLPYLVGARFLLKQLLDGGKIGCLNRHSKGVVRRRSRKRPSLSPCVIRATAKRTTAVWRGPLGKLIFCCKAFVSCRSMKAVSSTRTCIVDECSVSPDIDA